MIRSRLKRLRIDKEERESRKLTYRTIAEEAGISSGVVVRLMNGVPERIDTATLNTLCTYFGVGVGDLLEFVPDDVTAGGKEGKA